MITLDLMLRAPELYQQIADAARKRALGTADAAEQADAVSRLSEWAGASADATVRDIKRTYAMFDGSKAADLALAQRAEVALLSATKNADDIKAMLQKADAYPAIEVDLHTNEVQKPDVTGMHKEALDRIWRKHQDLKSEVERLLKAGDEVDRQFAYSSPEITVDQYMKNYPLPSNINIPPPPEGKSENMGYWAIGQYRQNGPETVGFRPWDPDMLPGYKKPPNVGTEWMAVNKNWVFDKFAPSTYLQERYDIRFVGREYTPLQTTITDDLGRNFTAQWVDNVYEARRTVQTVTEAAPSTDLPRIGSWQPISQDRILELSKAYPNDTIRFPIAQTWRFPEHNGMPSGGVAEMINGQVARTY